MQQTEQYESIGTNRPFNGEKTCNVHLFCASGAELLLLFQEKQKQIQYDKREKIDNDGALHGRMLSGNDGTRPD